MMKNSPRTFDHLPRVDPGVLGLLPDAMPAWRITSEHLDVLFSQLVILLRESEKTPAFLPLVQTGLFWIWQRRPLDHRFTDALRKLDDHAPFLTPNARALLGLLDTLVRPPEDASLFSDILNTGDEDMAEECVRATAKDPVHGLYWLGRTWPWITALPDPGKARFLYQAYPINRVPRLAQRLAAEFALITGETEACADICDTLDNEIWGLFAAYLAGHVSALAGDAQEAAAHLLPLHRALPWHVNIILKLYDILNPSPATPARQDDAAVLLYSMNKADLFLDTLTGLAETDLDGARVIVLDNGSTDHTPEAIQKASLLFPRDAFTTITLPANVGAPGARNWLLSLPETRRCAYAAFLDDDAKPPKDWLRRLLSTAKANPGAGAVGCAIVDLPPPHRHQSVDFNILPPHMGDSRIAEIRERIFLLDPCSETHDLGMYEYTRPCLSVSGCCHLINMRAVEACGPFDVRFNPTQFDDLERDMRSTLNGFPTVYDGRLKVRHVRFSSLAQAESPAKATHILGNKIKLEALFDDSRLETLVHENHAALRRDILTKAGALRREGNASGGLRTS